MAAKKPPAGLLPSGRRLWQAVVGDYDLEVHEELLLIEACRCADRLDRLATDSKDAPLTVVNTRGDQVAHPSLVELADTVTEMREVKHAYQKGILAQRGIEY